MSAPWLKIRRGEAPLLVSLPHTGVEIPADCRVGLLSEDRARQDTDWYVDRLYAFVAELDATIIHTGLSRTVIDVNRDPSGASLYPGQATTGLVPTETFDGLPLYERGFLPDPTEVERRKQLYFAPYHSALGAELARLRQRHAHVVLYDCHSIRSVIPRLFPGELPAFNIGTNDGRSCDPELADRIARVCASSGQSYVVNGRFKGGWITRRYGDPTAGIQAVQMELAMRAYLADERAPLWDPDFALPTQRILRAVLQVCVAFVKQRGNGVSDARSS